MNLIDQGRVSIIIPTYNGASKLPSLMDALAVQTNRDFEIVVVVDGSTDNTLAVLEKYKLIFQRLKVIHQQNAGRSIVRNRGVKEANGDLLIFYDDDMIPYPNSVQRHIEFYESHNQAILAGMTIELQTRDKTDIQNYKSHLSEKWLTPYTEDFTSLNFSNLLFPAANASMAKSTFIRLNGFDERLTDAEDYDLAYRALEMGVPVYLDKSNKAIHQEFITAKSYIGRCRAYSKANRKLIDLHPNRRTAKPNKKNLMERTLYHFFANSLFVKMIDADTLKTIVSKKLRYKFYDIVIQACAVEFPETKL